MDNTTKYKEGLALTCRPVYDLVVVLCKDYDRRRKAIKENKLEPTTLSLYAYFNDTIDASIREICEPVVCEIMREDIGNQIGPKRSRIHYMAWGTYKKRKRESIERIAKNLHLL